jgi:hypothetical protein
MVIMGEDNCPEFLYGRRVLHVQDIRLCGFL